MITSEKREVPLHLLRDGAEYPLGNINMRRDHKTDDLGPLKASLRENGQLQNMVGSTYQGSDEVYLIIGNRRRAAAQQNQDDRPKLALNVMDVRVFADLSIEQAMEIALAEEVTKLPPHKIDQYEAFAALAGQSTDAIAAHFDCSERLVKQRMRLGSLSPKIRQAWRDGAIDEATAQAFTLAPDTKTQDKALAALARTHSLNPRAVRARLMPDQGDLSRLLHFAGDDYVARKGEVIVDLFDDEHGVADPALLKAAAVDKLAGIVQAHIAEDGFAWAQLLEQMPAEWEGWKLVGFKPAKPGKEAQADLNMLGEIIASADSTHEQRRAARVQKQRIEQFHAVKGISEADRAKSGVVLWVSGDGGVDRAIGVIQPKANAPKILEDKTSSAKPPAKNAPVQAGKAAEAEAPPRLSLKAQTQRAHELTTAAAQVLERNPGLALVVLIAGFADRGSYGAIRATIGGSGANALQLMQTDDIAQNVKRLRGMKASVLQKLVGQAAAASLIFQAHSAERAAIEDKGVAAIIALLPPKDLAVALKRVFDPEDYFGKSLPKELALDAIRENCGQNVFEDQRAVHSATDLRAFALANIKADWLPPELRFPGYAGPGAKKKAAPAKAKKKAKRS